MHARLSEIIMIKSKHQDQTTLKPMCEHIIDLMPI